MVLLAYIALGGLLGTVARYAIEGWMQVRVGTASFPIGTFVINVLGSLALGFMIRYGTASTVFSPALRGGLTIGFCGAFTTMSTFSYETMRLLADGEYWYAGVYMTGTMLGCLAAVIIGTALASRLL